MKDQKMNESQEQEPQQQEFSADERDAVAGESEEDLRDASEEEDLLLAELDQLKAENAELKELSLRRMAEMDNMRKRMRKERLQQISEAKADSIKHFLPVNDDLQRTLKAIDELDLDERARDVVDGVRLVASKLEEALRRYDVVRINETGVPFDVDLHDALMRRPAGEADVEPNTILDVLESGYRMGDRTIRFAKVIVSE